MSALEVVDPGALTLVQDVGRPGLASLGVGPSGAADRRSHALANRLVANLDDAATLEVLLGGLALRAHGTVTIAVTGADVDVTVDDVPHGMNGPVTVRDGEVLRLGQAWSGLRVYVAVRGGVDVPTVLGSRSTDTLSGLGPAPVEAGDVLAVGTPSWSLPPVDVAPVAPPTDDEVRLRVVRGPRDDWVATPNDLVTTTWTVSPRSDRIGLRLSPSGTGPLSLDTTRQLPSEGLVRGAIQVPPSGEPVVLVADHPVTGGYPVVGVVVDADVDLAAQVRPGQAVRLRWA